MRGSWNGVRLGLNGLDRNTSQLVEMLDVSNALSAGGIPQCSREESGQMRRIGRYCGRSQHLLRVRETSACFAIDSVLFRTLLVSHCLWSHYCRKDHLLHPSMKVGSGYPNGETIDCAT